MKNAGISFPAFFIVYLPLSKDFRLVRCNPFVPIRVQPVYSLITKTTYACLLMNSSTIFSRSYLLSMRYSQSTYALIEARSILERNNFCNNFFISNLFSVYQKKKHMGNPMRFQIHPTSVGIFYGSVAESLI